MKWTTLCRQADDVIRRTRQSLPPPVREIADPIPVVYYPVPTPEMVSDGIEPDLLGLFLGPDLPGRLDDATFDPLPTEILLFLENILDYAEDDLPTFREEVRLTYLHELGHLLGLDETDLADRSLD